MSKLYSIALVNISDLRENKLESLLNGGDSNTYKGKYEFIWNRNNRLESDISFRAKVYKTIKGTENFINQLNLKYSNKEIRLLKGLIIDGRWGYQMKYDISQKTLVVIDVTDNWNSLVDNEIYNKTRKFNKDILNLNKKKV
jgi:hypothetical protein